MKILLDMNLSPAWTPVLEKAGIKAVHWSSVGAHDADDVSLLQYAREHGYIIFTHDLDFGAILAATHAVTPSVIQLRTQDISPGQAASIFLDVIRHFSAQLEQGALISVDADASRVRVLPINNLLRS